jgi:branched-chain amino acid transport system permease protein
VQNFLEYAVQGLLLGVTYGLIALPIGLFYMTIRTLDVAVGGYAAASGIVAATVGGIAGVTAGLLTGVTIAMGVSIIYRLLVKRGIGDPITVVAATFGVGMAIDSVILWQHGTSPLISQLFTGFWSVGGISINPQSVLNLAIGIVMVGLALVVLFATSVGRQLRASADNVLGALLAGVPVVRLQYLTFFVQGLLAAIAGVLLVYTSGLDFTSGTRLTLAAFGAAILFGLRGPVHCFLGGLVLGLVEGLVGGYGSGGLTTMLPFLFVLLVLVASPRVALAGRP